MSFKRQKGLKLDGYFDLAALIIIESYEKIAYSLNFATTDDLGYRQHTTLKKARLLSNFKS